MRSNSESGRFYALCSEIVLVYSKRMVREQPDIDSKDLAHDVLVNVIKSKLFERTNDKMNSFNLEGYLYQSVRYRFFELIKKKNKETKDLEKWLTEWKSEAVLLEKEVQIEDLIKDFLNENEQHREKIEVFLKKYNDGKSGEAIAEEYNVKPNLIYQWINRAKYHLAAYLTAKGITPENYFEQ